MKDWTWNRWRSIDIGSTEGSMIRWENHLGSGQGNKTTRGKLAGTNLMDGLLNIKENYILSKSNEWAYIEDDMVDPSRTVQRMISSDILYNEKVMGKELECVRWGTSMGEKDHLPVGREALSWMQNSIDSLFKFQSRNRKAENWKDSDSNIIMMGEQTTTHLDDIESSKFREESLIKNWVQRALRKLQEDNRRLLSQEDMVPRQRMRSRRGRGGRNPERAFRGEPPILTPIGE